jgi:integrase
LASLDGDRVAAWVKNNSHRPTRTRLAHRLLRAFLNWCAEHETYRELADAKAATSRKARDRLGKPRAKSDALQSNQLAAWFAAVKSEPNAVVSAFLQSLLISGARPEEWMRLRWSDVDFRWSRVRLLDKVDGERVIPLTRYAASLLGDLPRRNEWVFSSPSGASGRLRDPRHNHKRALAKVGLPPLTLHGLRRSFGSLAEWVECPAGVVATIQGHKPSATAEKHYRVRQPDFLMLWHQRIEDWMLENAGARVADPLPRPRLAVVAA